MKGTALCSGPARRGTNLYHIWPGNWRKVRDVRGNLTPDMGQLSLWLIRITRVSNLIAHAYDKVGPYNTTALEGLTI